MAVIAPLIQRQIDRLLAAALFSATLALFLRTLCPTIYWGDCGELVTAADSLGIAHSTGYPVWCLIGKAWTLLFPFGSVVWRLNVLSAIFGALAVCALFGFARALSLPRALAVTVAGLFAVSHTFWQQCLFAETYSLTACYTCTLLWLAARWRQRGCRPGDLRWLAVAYGFALTNHQTNTLFLPGFVAFILWTDPTLRPVFRNAAVRRRWASAILPGLLPLLFYAYLPLRAHAQPAANWGDPQTPYAFFYHVTGRPYAPLMFNYSFHASLRNVGQWMLGLGGEYAWPIVACAVFGLTRLWRRDGDRPLAALLSWIVLTDVVYTTNYTIYNAYIYFIPGYAALAALAGCGLRDAWQRLAPTISESKRPAYASLAAACLLLMVPVQVVGHWAANDLSRNWTCADYGRNLLRSCPPNAVLINNGGDTGESAVNYLQKVEGYRLDVTLVNRGILSAIFDAPRKRWANIWYFEQLQRRYPEVGKLYANGKIQTRQALEEDVLRRLIAQAVGARRPVTVIEPGESGKMYDGSGPKINFLDFLNRHYETAQVGLTLRVYARGERPAPSRLLKETRRVQTTFQTRGVYEGVYLGDEFLTTIALDYFNADISHARLARTQNAWIEAEDAYNRAGHLFRSGEVTTGLSLCAQARQEAKR